MLRHKRSRTLVRLNSFLTLSLTLISFASCIAVRGNDLPSRAEQKAIGQEQQPYVGYEVLFVRVPTRCVGSSHEIMTITEEINSLFYENGVFRRPRSDGAGLGFHIRILLEKKCPTDSATSLLSAYAAWLSGVTLAIIPLHYRRDYFMAITVQGGDQVLKQYEYKEHMNIWYQFPLFLILSPFFDPKDTERHIIHDLLLNLLYDLSKDQTFLGYRPLTSN